MVAATEPGIGDVLEGDDEGAAVKSLNTVERDDWKPAVEPLFFDRVDDEEFEELGEVYRALRKCEKQNRLLGLVMIGKTEMGRQELSEFFESGMDNWFDGYREAGLWDGELTDRGKEMFKDVEELRSSLRSDQWKHERSTIKILESLDFSGDLQESIYEEVVEQTAKDSSLPEVLRGKVDDYQYLGKVFEALSGDRLKVFAHYAGHDTGYSHEGLSNYIGRPKGMIDDAVERFYELDLMYAAGNELTFMGEQVFEMIQEHYEDLSDDEGF